MEPDVKYVDCYSEERDEIFRIEKKICPRCGNDLADHGFGLVCTHPLCRQAIKMKTVEEKYKENIMKRFTEVK